MGRHAECRLPRRYGVGISGAVSLCASHSPGVLDMTQASLSTEFHSATLAPRLDLYIDGQWVQPEGGVYRDIVDPATENVLTQAADASVADVQQIGRAHV